MPEEESLRPPVEHAPILMEFNREVKSFLEEIGVVGVYAFWLDEFIGTVARYAYAIRGSWLAYEITDPARLGLVQVASEIADTIVKGEDAALIEKVSLIGKLGGPLSHMIVAVMEGKNNENSDFVRSLLREAASQVVDDKTYDNLPTILEEVFLEGAKARKEKGKIKDRAPTPKIAEIDQKETKDRWNSFVGVEVSPIKKSEPAGFFRRVFGRSKTDDVGSNIPPASPAIYAGIHGSISQKDLFNLGKSVGLQISKFIDKTNLEQAGISKLLEDFWLKLLGTSIKATVEGDKITVTDANCWICVFIRGSGMSCTWSAGVIQGALEAQGLKVSRVVETDCKAEGKEACTFQATIFRRPTVGEKSSDLAPSVPFSKEFPATPNLPKPRKTL